MIRPAARWKAAGLPSQRVGAPLEYISSVADNICKSLHPRLQIAAQNYENVYSKMRILTYFWNFAVGGVCFDINGETSTIF